MAVLSYTASQTSNDSKADSKSFVCAVYTAIIWLTLLCVPTIGSFGTDDCSHPGYRLTGSQLAGWPGATAVGSAYQAVRAIPPSNCCRALEVRTEVSAQWGLQIKD